MDGHQKKNLYWHLQAEAIKNDEIPPSPPKDVSDLTLTIEENFQKGVLLTLDRRQAQGKRFLLTCHNNILSKEQRMRTTADWIRLFFCYVFMDDIIIPENLSMAFLSIRDDVLRIFRHSMARDLFTPISGLGLFKSDGTYPDNFISSSQGSHSRSMSQLIPQIMAGAAPTLEAPQPYEELGELLLHGARIKIMKSNKKDAGLIIKPAMELLKTAVDKKNRILEKIEPRWPRMMDLSNQEIRRQYPDVKETFFKEKARVLGNVHLSLQQAYIIKGLSSTIAGYRVSNRNLQVAMENFFDSHITGKDRVTSQLGFVEELEWLFVKSSDSLIKSPSDRIRTELLDNSSGL